MFPQIHPLHNTFLQYQSEPHNNKYQHPFSIAFKILKNNKTNITLNHNIQPANGPITSLPKYDIFEMPTNYQINTKPQKQCNIQHTENNFFTDGSCVPNPGKGAYGWYTPNYNHQQCQEIIQYKYPTTITNCETMAILAVLICIKNKLPTNSKIFIFTDCQTVLQYLTFQAYPKYNNVKQIIQAVLNSLTIIQHKSPKTKIYINKVKSHSGY